MEKRKLVQTLKSNTLLILIFLFFMDSLSIAKSLNIGNSVIQQDKKKLQKITGTVTKKKDNKPISKVTIMAIDPTAEKPLGTITDVKGNYSFEIPKTTKKISFSYPGMKTKIINIKDSKIINVELEEKEDKKLPQ
ncbi:hypothetical protein ES705_17284 [subsurface metagenome]